MTLSPLLVEPTDPQARLLDVVYRGREQAGCPNFLPADARGQVQRVGTPGDLALQQPSTYDGDYWKSWILRGLVRAAQAGLLNNPTQGPAGIAPLSIAQEHILRLPYLREDISPQADSVITSLCQFELLMALAVRSVNLDGSWGGWLPSFARWNAVRSDPAAVALIEDPGARAAIFPHGDQELADALRALAALAHHLVFTFGAWEGYEDPRIKEFLSHHPASDPAQLGFAQPSWPNPIERRPGRKLPSACGVRLRRELSGGDGGRLGARSRGSDTGAVGQVGGQR